MNLFAKLMAFIRSLRRQGRSPQEIRLAISDALKAPTVKKFKLSNRRTKSGRVLRRDLKRIAELEGDRSGRRRVGDTVYSIDYGGTYRRETPKELSKKKRHRLGLA